jgi:membrane protein
VADASTPWGFVLHRTVSKFSTDKCTDLAATLTYFGVLSIFPALLALVSILGLVGQQEQGVKALLAVAQQFAPGSAISLIRGPIEHFAASGTAGLGLIVGIVGAIWSASGYVGAFGRAANRIYGVAEGRSGIRLRGVQLLVTIVTLVLTVLIALILVLSGPIATAIGSTLHVGNTPLVVWSILKWPVLAVALVLVVAVLYYATPNVKLPRFRVLSLGALAAVIVLGVASVAFGFYIANFGNYDRTYGSLAGVIIFLLWIWIANLALLFGVEFDVEVLRGRQLVAGLDAEVAPVLPLRATKAIRSAENKRDKDILRARRIRADAAAKRAEDADREAMTRT